MKHANLISTQELQFFHENGFLVKRKFVDLSVVEAIQNKVAEHLKNRVKPFELEQEVHYPGSPKTKEETGGDTIRRLLLAHSRDDIFAQWQKSQNATSILKTLFDSKTLYLVQSHHNCIMTKQPQYSSETHWHKDTRYWGFQNQQLINTWLPLGDETIENGCLQVIPGSHQWDTPRECLDDRLFLRKDLDCNQEWLAKAIDVELNKGDLLFFYAAVFHAAGSNKTPQSKNALVSTYHSEKNQEIVSPFPDLKPVKIS
jgi:phytanoyl-CoA hydroxylase